MFQRMAAGRNDRCPCGSGKKYKRCCLDRLECLIRDVSAIEAVVSELGRAARVAHRDEYAEAFSDFYHGGEEAFGLAGPDASERLEADLWIVCDRTLGGDGTPLGLATARGEDTVDPSLDALARSALRTWKIEAVRGAGLLEARCPLTGEFTRLETIRRPEGDLGADSLVVARSVPRDGGSFALLGRAPVVEPRARDDFEDLLGQLAVELRHSDHVWREGGGVLASAAWSWPDEREHTLEGDVVQERFVSFKLPDAGAAMRALDADSDFVRTGQEFWDSDVIAWYRLAREVPSAVEMPTELGVEWFLCDEDTADPPQVAKLELNLDERDVWLFAPSERRLDGAERDFVERFGQLLGDVDHRGVDLPEITPRWKRERHNRFKADIMNRYLVSARTIAA
jgi:hypothetical protein